MANCLSKGRLFKLYSNSQVISIMSWITLLALGFVLLSSESIAAPLPRRIDTCTETTIKEVGYRLSSRDAKGVYVPIAGSGSSVKFANGGYQVSYDNVSAIQRSQPVDKLKVCLLFIPDCSKARPGDQRGRIYKTTNLRTGESWTLPDSQHRCGGA